MAKASRKEKGASTGRSPLYTSKVREIAKREAIAAAGGRDIDGAYRVNRKATNGQD